MKLRRRQVEPQDVIVVNSADSYLTDACGGNSLRRPPDLFAAVFKRRGNSRRRNGWLTSSWVRSLG
jgi:hypothetical protein